MFNRKTLWALVVSLGLLIPLGVFGEARVGKKTHGTPSQYQIRYGIEDAGITAEDCIDPFLPTSTLDCNGTAAAGRVNTFVPAGHSLHLQQIYVRVTTALDTNEDCNYVLEWGTNDDLDTVTGTIATIPTGDGGAGTDLEAPGDVVTEAIDQMLPEGSWFRIRITARATCTAQRGATIVVSGVLY